MGGIWRRDWGTRLSIVFVFNGSLSVRISSLLLHDDGVGVGRKCFTACFESRIGMVPSLYTCCELEILARKWVLVWGKEGSGGVVFYMQ